MADRIMGTPYFLDEFAPDVAAIISQPRWVLNQPALPDGDIHLHDVNDLLDYRLPADPTYVHFDVGVLNTLLE